MAKVLFSLGCGMILIAAIFTYAKPDIYNGFTTLSLSLFVAAAVAKYLNLGHKNYADQLLPPPRPSRPGGFFLFTQKPHNPHDRDKRVVFLFDDNFLFLTFRLKNNKILLYPIRHCEESATKQSRCYKYEIATPSEGLAMTPVI